MPKTRDKDPSQSLWISEKYEKELVKQMQLYYDGIISLSKKYYPDTAKIKEETDKLKAELLTGDMRATVEKYITMSVQQGSKFAKLRLKRVNK